MAVAAPLILGAQLVGGGISAVGAMQEGQAAYRAGMYQSAVARNMAAQALQAGQAEEQKLRMETNATIAQQRVAAAASGVDVNSGSPLDVQLSAEYMGEMDAKMIRENARRRGNAYLEQARLAEMEAEDARRAGFLKGFSSILGSATSVGTNWLNFRHTGVMQ